jgi:hypothetical protein
MLYHAYNLFGMMVDEGLSLDAQAIVDAASMINAAAGAIIATLSFLGGFTLNSLPWLFSILAFVTVKGD